MNGTRTMTAGALAFLWLAASGSLRADTLTLKNGREIRGRLVEETAEEITIRTGRGVITVPKSEVATFTEDEDWGDDYPGPPWRPAVPAPESPAEPIEADTAAVSTVDLATVDAWPVPADLPPETRALLTRLRDRYVAELMVLGPTKEARLEAVRTSPEEQARLEELVLRFASRRSHVRRRGGAQGASPQQRVGSVNRKRINTREDVLDFGVKAIPVLVDAVASDSFWRRRLAAQALGESAADGEDAVWLLYHFDAPRRLLVLLEERGQLLESPFIRQDADQALRAITGHSVGFEPSTEAEPTPAEASAAKGWREWWPAERARWLALEAEKERARRRMLAVLGEIKAGRIPAAETPPG